MPPPPPVPGSRAGPTPARPALVLALAAAAALPSLRPRPAAGQASRPNIVFLFSDDHAAHALSAYRPHLGYGARLPDTPSLDALASEGMLFTNAFVTNSICAPSRAAVLTGQYGHLNGVMSNAEALHPSSTTFPGLLRNAGYRTAVFGKWHLKAEPGGFDWYEVLAGQGPYHNPVLHTPTDSLRHQGYTTDVVVDRALEWIEGRRRDQPFLAMVHFNAAHRYWDPGPDQLSLHRDTALAEPATLRDDGRGRASPAAEQEMEIGRDLFARDLKLEAPRGLTPEQQAAWDAAYGPENRRFAEAGLQGDALLRWKYQRYIGDYMRTVAGLDAAIGRLLERLDAAGLAENTVVVYTSDQGFFLGDHGWFDKRWMYEESLRTPLLVRWPGVVAPGAVEEALVMNLDLAETLLEIGGAAAPASMQGESLVPLLRGARPADWRTAVYYQYFAWPDWHMVRRQHGVRTSRYKLIHYYEIGEWELFDLARDPEELVSVWGDPAYAGVVQEMERRLAELRERYRAPDEDPVPYTPFAPDPALRRPGALPTGVPFRGVSEARPTGSPDISDEALVGAWDMTTRTPDGRLRDFGGRRLHGDAFRAATVPAPFGGAQDFSEVERRVHLPEDPAFDLDGPLTVAAWLRVDVGGLHQHVAACDDKWALWVTPDDRYRLGDTRGGGWSTSPGAVETGRWTSVVAVLRGTRGEPLTPESVTLYVDGVPAEAELHMRSDEARERVTWGPGELYPDDACYVGFESHQGNAAHQTLPFAGAVDELLVFGRAWSEAEVAAFSRR